jgi:hypothetical protein
MVPNDFWLFPKIKSALNGRRFQDIEDIQKKKCDDDTESCSTRRVPKIFPAVTVSLGQVHICSKGVLRR